MDDAAYRRTRPPHSLEQFMCVGSTQLAHIRVPRVSGAQKVGGTVVAHTDGSCPHLDHAACVGRRLAATRCATCNLALEKHSKDAVCASRLHGAPRVLACAHQVNLDGDVGSSRLFAYSVESARRSLCARTDPQRPLMLAVANENGPILRLKVSQGLSPFPFSLRCSLYFSLFPFVNLLEIWGEAKAAIRAGGLSSPKAL